MKPGMIPILHSEGVIKPGQFGPIKYVLLLIILFFISIISKTGIPSVMHTINSMFASKASWIALAANLAGT